MGASPHQNNFKHLFSCGSASNGCLLQNRADKEDDCITFEPVDQELASELMGANNLKVYTGIRHIVAVAEEEKESKVYLWGEAINPNQEENKKDEVFIKPLRLTFFQPGIKVTQVACGF